MSDVRDLLAEALEEAVIFDEPAAARQNADFLLATEPGQRLAKAAALGLAWEAALAALPEGWQVTRLQNILIGWGAGKWTATAERLDGPGSEDAIGPSPTEALLALTAQLRERS